MTLDRIEAMVAFVAVADAGGFSVAARKLGRSAASMTRAVAFLEERTGSEFLRRTTRSMRVTEAGERYLVACRRILSELAQADEVAAVSQAAPRGVLAVTAPVTFGRLHVRPLVAAFLDANADVQVRILLLDRVVSLIDEGIDVAVRIGHMPDSSLIAARVGDVRRVVCASRDYIARVRRPREPSDLAKHTCIAFSQTTPTDTWTFSGGAEGARPRVVKVHPRITVNSADAAIAFAVEGGGVTSVLSYQVERELREGALVRLLPTFEPEPIPVYVVYPAASASSAKVRAFTSVAIPGLKRALARMRPGAKPSP